MLTTSELERKLAWGTIKNGSWKTINIWMDRGKIRSHFQCGPNENEPGLYGYMKVTKLITTSGVKRCPWN